jgi:hypothetical protein
MKYTDDLDDAIQQPIENYIPAERQAPQARRQVVANAAYERMSGQKITMLLQSCNEARGVSWIVSGNKAANFD